MTKNTDGTEWRTVRVTVIFDVDVMADNDEEALMFAAYTDEVNMIESAGIQVDSMVVIER